MNEGVALSIRQFREAWRLMGSSCPGTQTGTGGGIDYVFSGLPVSFFNMALVTEHDVSRAALEAHGKKACDWASDKAVPWLFVVTHEAIAPGIDATSVLDGCGLVPMLPLTGMLAQHVLPGTRVPDGLQLEVPREDAGCSAMLDINAAAYGVDLEACKSSIGRQSFWADQVLVLGLAGGKPVTSATVLMADGYRYVALVATDPTYQRRGYAEAAMRHALDVAAHAHGDRPTFLHASDAGRPIYARMGYTTTSTHTAFIEKKFLADH